jgi:hypothetical protein
MTGDEERSERPFKVQDRRRFSATGETREDVAPGAAEAAPEEPAPPPSPPIPEAAPAAGTEAPEITFPTFIISLTTQALAHLGEIPDPVERTTHVDLDAARQIIDILGLLSTKTRGNLDAGEGALLESALYDLRMKYVARAHGR